MPDLQNIKVKKKTVAKVSMALALIITGGGG